MIGRQRWIGRYGSKGSGIPLQNTGMKLLAAQRWESGLNLNLEPLWVCVSPIYICPIFLITRAALTLDIVFDNWRMLHGRSEFTGKRRMCGGYSMCSHSIPFPPFLWFLYTSFGTANWLDTVNNDDFVSRYRLLKFGRERALNYIGKTPDPLDITWTRQPRKRRTNAASSDSGPVQI